MKLDSRQISIFCGAVVAAVAVAVLAGWALDVDFLKSVAPGLATMKVNAALAFLFCSASLIFGRMDRDPRIVQGLALGALCIAGATLVEYAAGLDLGIDQLLVTAAREKDLAIPGRMSPFTAASFALLAIALALPRAPQWIGRNFLALTLLGVSVPFLALVGYAFGVSELYNHGPFTSMAVHTAIAFIVLFVGISLSRPDVGWVGLLRSSGPGGSIAKWLLPVVVLLPPILGWLVIQGEARGLYGFRAGIALLSVAFVVVLSAIVWRGARRVDILDRARLRQQQLHTTVLQSSLDAFILIDAEGRIVEWNPQAEQIFGSPRREALGRYLADTIIPEKQRDAVAGGLKHFLVDGKSKILNRRVELIALRRSGEEFPVEMVVTPIRLGPEILFSGFVRDISSQKEIESQLRQAQKMEAVGQLTGGIAHDFNNLLTVVIGNLETASKRAPPEQRPLLQSALMAAERGARLVEQLLTASRRRMLAPTALDLSALVPDMIDLLRRSLGQQIEIDVVRNGTPCLAFGDKGQIENALLNLSINARDAMPGGGKLTIETSCVSLDAEYAKHNPDVTPGEYAMLAVTDTGTGMSPDVMERAFEPFFTTKEVGKGTGLGLSMVHGFAKQSGGHLKIYSGQGHGTTVKLYLPRATDAKNVVPSESGADARGRTETVLVVEDDDEVRDYAASQLSDLGYRVIQAANGKEARKILASSESIDLLFTDVVMPGGISGLVLADQAKLLRPTLRTLFTSGYAANSIVRQRRLDPNIAFLAKPYRRQELARKVRDVIDSANNRRAGD